MTKFIETFFFISNYRLIKIETNFSYTKWNNITAITIKLSWWPEKEEDFMLFSNFHLIWTLIKVSRNEMSLNKIIELNFTDIFHWVDSKNLLDAVLNATRKQSAHLQASLHLICIKIHIHRKSTVNSLLPPSFDVISSMLLAIKKRKMRP